MLVKNGINVLCAIKIRNVFLYIRMSVCEKICICLISKRRLYMTVIVIWIFLKNLNSCSFSSVEENSAVKAIVK